MSDAPDRGRPASRARVDLPRCARRVGPGRVLLGLYLLFVLAAGARSAVQLILHASRAPLAYALSAAAAAVYLAGFVLVRRVERGAALVTVRALTVCSSVELAGVLTVGTLSVVDRGLFAEPTVWSCYGAGYLLVPLVLPLGVLAWLRVVSTGQFT